MHIWRMNKRRLPYRTKRTCAHTTSGRRTSDRAPTHLNILDYSASHAANNTAALRMYGLLGSELFAEVELEVDRLFAAVSSQFEQAYNNDYTSKAVESVCSRRRGSLTRK